MQQKTGQFVQYGCGLSAPEGWLNFDASPTLRLQKLPLVGGLFTRGRARFPVGVRHGDVVAGLPIETGTCSGVYCSHVLEHLSLADLRIALRETYRVLEPGGIFRGVLPDLEGLAKAYLADPSSGAALTFMQASLLGVPARTRGVRGIVTSALGNSHHLWMWDYKSLAVELADAGFQDIRRAYRGDSVESRFSTIENPERWDDCLGFECRR